MKNKADMRSMFKDAMVLFVITLFAGLALGFVYELTKDPIRIQQEFAIKKACKEVFAQADSFEALHYTPSEQLALQLKEEGVTVDVAYGAYDEAGNALGYVVQTTTSEGYGGKMTLYIGVTNTGVVNGVSILEIAETPGLGMQAEEVLTPQFAHKAVELFTYTKTGSTLDSEIDAISGATVTTKAFINAVNGGLRAIHEELMVEDWVREGGMENE